MAKKWWITIALILFAALIISFVIGVNGFRTSYAQDNFPLKEEWSVHFDRGVEALTVADDKTLLARTGNSLNALDLQTGRVIWSQNLSWQGEPQRAIASNGIVYIADGKGVKAFKQADGALIWQQPVSSISALVMDISKEVLAAEDWGYLKFYDAVSGSLLREETACRNFRQAYIINDNIYIPCDGILGINFLSGQKSWWEEDKGLVGYVGYGDGIMYYSPAKPLIKALDLKSWKKLWQVSVKIDGFERFAVSSDYLLFTDFSKTCVFERTNGQELWCQKVTYPQNPTILDV